MSSPKKPPVKLPPSIQNATLEELQRLTVDTLKKLKARDKRISELEAAGIRVGESSQAVKEEVPSSDAGKSEVIEALERAATAEKKVGDLEASLTAYREKVITFIPLQKLPSRKNS